MTAKPFIFGQPGRPALVLAKPSSGELVFRRLTKGREGNAGVTKVDTQFVGDVRVNVRSLKAARQLLTVAQAIVRAKEQELLKHVVPLEGYR